MFQGKCSSTNLLVYMQWDSNSTTEVQFTFSFVCFPSFKTNSVAFGPDVEEDKCLAPGLQEGTTKICLEKVLRTRIFRGKICF